jgi:DNA-binding CsgD family transcriptional regulator
VSTYITAEEYAEIKRRLELGERPGTIAAVLGRSRHGLDYSIARIRAGMPYARPVNTKAVRQEMESRVKNLRGLGHSTPCIASQCKISGQTVLRILGNVTTYKSCGCLKKLAKAKKGSRPLCDLEQKVIALRATAVTNTHIRTQLNLSRSRLNRIISRLIKAGLVVQKEAMIKHREAASYIRQEAKKRPVEKAKPNRTGKSDPPAPLPVWTDGRVRYLGVLRRAKTVLDFMPEELNREFPHLPRVTVVDVRNRIYGS